MIGRLVAASRPRRSTNASTRHQALQQKPHRSYALNSHQFYKDSPIDTIKIGSHHRVHVKRDDLLGEPDTGGNKARKLAGFRQLISDGQSRQDPINAIASSGGCQSNAMLAIAHFAHEHHLDFHFFSPPVSAKARSESHGNLASSLALGMKLHESQNPEEALEEWKTQSAQPGIMVIPRGVSCELAEVGLKQLAEEIDAHFQSVRTDKTRSLIVVLPSGTGTTATYLNKHLQILSRHGNPYDTKTLGVSIAMKPNDLQTQIEAQFPNEVHPYPVFTHPSKKRIMFARPDPHVKAIWCTLKRKGLLLDLIYGPVAWMSLFELLPSIDPEACEVYYIHTGGLTGNETQLHRYQTTDACAVPRPPSTPSLTL